MTDQLTLEQSLREIFPTLPIPVQRFIKEGKTGEATQKIMDHYVLHVDQGGIIEHQILLSLFGVISPEELIEALTDQLSVSDQTVEDIIGDINKEVFVPLREEMRRGGNVQQQTPRAVPQVPVRVGAPPVSSFPRTSQPVAPAMPRPNVPPPPSYGAPAASAPQRYVPPPAPRPAAPAPAVQAERVSLPVNFTPPPPAPSSHIAPLPPKLVMPPAQGFPNRAVASLPPKFSDYSTGRPAARPAMEEIPAMLPLGEEEPDLSDHPINLISRPPAATPAPSFPPRQPRFAPPPANLPGAIFHGELSAPSDAAISQPRPVSPSMSAGTSSLRGAPLPSAGITSNRSMPLPPDAGPAAGPPKPYVSDPYHEPIDEEGSR